VFAVAHEPALQTASHSLGALPPSTGNRPAGKPRPVRRPDPLTCTLIWPNSGLTLKRHRSMATRVHASDRCYFLGRAGSVKVVFACTSRCCLTGAVALRPQTALTGSDRPWTIPQREHGRPRLASSWNCCLLIAARQLRTCRAS
jgi:hypothetical protein